MFKLYVIVLLAIFGGIVLHAPLSVGLGTLFPDYELLIKSWKEILMLLLVPVAAISITRHKMWRELMNDWIARLIVAYVALHFIIAGIFYRGAAETTAGLAIDLRYILFFSLVYVALKMMPAYRHRMLQIGVVGAFIVVGFATLQFFLPADILTHIGYSKETIMPYLTVDKNPDFIRVNSTLRGPNPLGAYAGMVLGLIAAAYARGALHLREKRVRVGTIILGVCSLVALWLSYSRSAWIGVLITLGAVALTVVLRKLPRSAWIATVVVVFAIVGALVVGRGNEFVSNVILHENPNGGSSISSNDGHARSLADGVASVLHHPLGVGVGSTGSASLYGNTPVIIENQYLPIAYETGWLGLALFLALFVLIMIRLWRGRADWLNLGVFASGLGLAFIGLLLPVWTDDTVAIIWWGLAAIALAGGSYARKQTK